mmetsp:Transcript_7864/g.15357  ORF Transcript_7864/g.15357 Transcript_7864/m.15357 type:complete len:88 (+) Transcript_7864:2889-3152(+)
MHSALKISREFTNLDYKDVANLYAAQTTKTSKKQTQKKKIDPGYPYGSKTSLQWDECRKAESDATMGTAACTIDSSTLRRMESNTDL